MPRKRLGLRREVRVVMIDRLLSGFNSFFFGGEVTYVLPPRVSAPAASLLFVGDANVTTGVVPTFSAVDAVLSVGRFSKVAESVVRAVSVNVINLLCGPFPVRKEPRYSVRSVGFALKIDQDVAGAVDGPDFVSWSLATGTDSLVEFSRFWVVQYFTHKGIVPQLGQGGKYATLASRQQNRETNTD